MGRSESRSKSQTPKGCSWYNLKELNLKKIKNPTQNLFQHLNNILTIQIGEKDRIQEKKTGKKHQGEKEGSTINKHRNK